MPSSTAPTVPTLGLVLAPGNSLTNIRRSGQLTRFLRTLSLYSSAFRVLLFSHIDETLGDLTDDVALLSRVRIVGSRLRARHREFSYWAPLAWMGDLASCDVVLVWHAIGALPAIAARWLRSIPFVPIYDYAYPDFALLTGRVLRARLVRAVELAAAASATRIICRTAALAARLPRRARQKSVLIPTGIDTSLFSPPASPRPLASGLFVGRLEPQKNLPSLLRGWGQAARDLPLTIVGGGSQRQALAEIAVTCGVHVHFAGSVANEALPSYYRDASFFVLPSLIEGLPKALLEAMSCGLPCLGTDVPGIRDVIRDGDTGLLCRGTTSESVADGLVRLRGDWSGALSMGLRARAQVVAENSFEAASRREIAVLSEAARARP